MSTLSVTVERLRIGTHPDADALELAEVGLYRAVVGKGVYASGDLAVYIPEQAILPAALIDELGLTGRLGGRAHDRVTAVRLRGQLSQGLVCRPTTLAGIDWETAYDERTDFAAALGITKWVPPVPPELAGRVVDAPDLLPWSDIENLRRYPDAFTPGERVQATEKVHGSACCLTFLAATGETLVSSKGFAARRQALAEDGGGLYWRAVRGFDLPAAARAIAGTLGADRVALFGEVYGPGVQDLRYGRTELGYTCFDAAVDVGGLVSWLGQEELRALLPAGVPTVPVLYDGPFDPDVLLPLAEGDTFVGAGAHLREGVVVRAVPERDGGVLGGRAIAKLVSPAYLTRKGGTEFE